MNQTPTYYELLEVSRTASAAQIRAAYLRLVKRYHPDVADTGVGSDLLPRLNEIYKALSDPARRAEYDSQLIGTERSRPAAGGGTSAVTLHAPYRPAPVWRRRTLGLVAALTCGAALAIGQLARGWVEPEQSYASPLSWLLALPPSDRAPALPFPSQEAIDRYAKVGASLAPDWAEERSRRCFFQARQLASRAAAQLCIVLDDAFLYSRTAPPSALTLYFDDVVVDSRHASALDVEPRGPLLDRLRKASFAALMAEFRGPPTPDRTPSGAVEQAPAPSRLAQSGTKSPINGH